MKAIDNLERQLTAIGAKLDNVGPGLCLCCDAPMGYCWQATGTPTLTIQFGNFQGQTWLGEALAYEAQNLRMGLYKVMDADELEEIRWNNDDDNWGANMEDAPARINFPYRA